MSTDARDTGATSPIDVPQEDTMTNPTTSDEHTVPLETGAATAPSTSSTSSTSSTTTASPTSTSATTPTGSPAPVAPRRRGPRVGTIVWGLVIAAIGAFIMAYALDVAFDEELAFIIVIAAAGVLLLLGSVVTTRRRRP